MKNINPLIRTLAQDAAAKIKQMKEGCSSEIETIEKDFRTRADAIEREASTKSLTGSGADSFSQPTE